MFLCTVPYKIFPLLFIANLYPRYIFALTEHKVLFSLSNHLSYSRWQGVQSLWAQGRGQHRMGCQPIAGHPHTPFIHTGTPRGNLVTPINQSMFLNWSSGVPRENPRQHKENIETPHTQNHGGDSNPGSRGVRWQCWLLCHPSIHFKINNDAQVHLPQSPGKSAWYFTVDFTIL